MQLLFWQSTRRNAMNVAGILKVKGSDIITAKPSDRIETVANILGEKRIGAVLVVDEAGKLCGVLSERDIVRGLSESGNGCL